MAKNKSNYIEGLKRDAKKLLKNLRAEEIEALSRFAKPHILKMMGNELAPAKTIRKQAKLRHAQAVIACEQGYDSWDALLKEESSVVESPIDIMQSMACLVEEAQIICDDIKLYGEIDELDSDENLYLETALKSVEHGLNAIREALDIRLAGKTEYDWALYSSTEKLSPTMEESAEEVQGLEGLPEMGDVRTSFRELEDKVYQLLHVGEKLEKIEKDTPYSPAPPLQIIPFDASKLKLMKLAPIEIGKISSLRMTCEMLDSFPVEERADGWRELVAYHIRTLLSFSSEEDQAKPNNTFYPGDSLLASLGRHPDIHDALIEEDQGKISLSFVNLNRLTNDKLIGFAWLLERVVEQEDTPRIFCECEKCGWVETVAPEQAEDLGTCRCSNCKRTALAEIPAENAIQVAAERELPNLLELCKQV